MVGLIHQTYMQRIEIYVGATKTLQSLFFRQQKLTDFWQVHSVPSQLINSQGVCTNSHYRASFLGAWETRLTQTQLNKIYLQKCSVIYLPFYYLVHSYQLLFQQVISLHSHSLL